MKLKISENYMRFRKELNHLDRLVLDFTRILDALAVDYVIVSGYVSILFGRNRSSEDIDVIIKEMNREKFEIVWEELTKKFECLNSADKHDAYARYILSHHALRFSRKGKFIPNVEIKFPKLELEKWTLDNRKKVVLNKRNLYISPIELQIPFKLFLGSEKDIEDARFLHKLFKGRIDEKLLKEFTKKLNIQKEFNKYLQ